MSNRDDFNNQFNNFLPGANETFNAATNSFTADQLTTQLIPLNGKATDIQTIGNWTSYNIERDYFRAADSFTLVLEDGRADEINASLQIGMQINFKINNQQVMVGFLDSFDYSYGRDGEGKSLVLQGRDLLGICADSTVFPNLGTGTQTDFSFKPTTTYGQAFQTIFAPYGATVNANAYQNLTLATGFKFGSKTKAKTPRGLSTSLKNQLNHLLKPSKGQQVLSYASVLCEYIGAHIKMAAGSSTLIEVDSPTYKRDNQTTQYAYEIGHISNNTSSNTVEHGAMRVSYKDQPSVIILEGTTGTATYKKQNMKVIAINEITGYNRNNISANQGTAQNLTLANAIPSVRDAVSQLTNKNGLGYKLIDPKLDLFNILPSTLVDLQTSFSRPMYILNDTGKTLNELQFICAKTMADLQRKYFSLEYHVHGHAQNGVVWAINTMCKVVDDAFDLTNNLDSVFWVERINFTKSRKTGVGTMVKLSLPYVYEFYIEPLPATSSGAPILPKGETRGPNPGGPLPQ